MLTSILLAIALLVQPATGPSNSAKLMTRDEAIKTIDRFLENPKLGEDAQAIMKFAEESEDCMIAVDEKAAPWAVKKPPYEQAKVLVAAYVAGDIKSQLQSKKVEDDPYAGMLAAIKVYNKLRETDKNLKIPEIEEQIVMENKGELKAHAEKIA